MRLLKHFFAWIAGMVVSAVGFIWQLEALESVNFAWWSLTILGFMVAGFQTWREDRREREKDISDHAAQTALKDAEIQRLGNMWTKARPPVYAWLEIDPAGDEGVYFKLHIQNGQDEITNVRFQISSNEIMFSENIPPGGRMLAPGGSFSTLMAPIPQKVVGFKKIIANIFYESTGKHLIASHRFLVSERDVKPQVVTPQSSNYEEGQMPDGMSVIPEKIRNMINDTFNPPKNFAQVFGRPEGSANLNLPERDAKGELIEEELKGDDRGFMFSAKRRYCELRIITTSGRAVELRVDLPEVKDGIQHLYVEWSKQRGAKLKAGDLLKEDFESPPTATTSDAEPTPSADA